MAEALYQKYRPARFADVQGEQHVVKALQRAAAAGSLSHAYVLYGPRGVGKTTIAKLLAKTVNCLAPTADGACGACASCEKVALGRTLDVVELDAASNNGVAEIRALIDTVGYLPADLKYKVYILDEAHMLTVGAWNALLKTLEDCPPHALFVFATTEQHKIPLTIVSRCQCFGLRPLPPATIKGLLKKIADAEKIPVDDAALAQLSSLARGSARDAITMLDQLRAYAADGGRLTVKEVESVFGLLGLDAKVDFVNKIAARDAAAASAALDAFEAGGANLALLVSDLLALCIDVYLAHARGAPGAMRVLDQESLGRVSLSGDDALTCAEVFEELVGKIRFSPDVKANLQLGVFRALQRMANPGAERHAERQAPMRPAQPSPSLFYGKLPPPAAPAQPERQQAIIAPAAAPKAETAPSPGANAPRGVGGAQPKAQAASPVPPPIPPQADPEAHKGDAASAPDAGDGEATQKAKRAERRRKQKREEGMPQQLSLFDDPQSFAPSAPVAQAGAVGGKKADEPAKDAPAPKPTDEASPPAEPKPPARSGGGDPAGLGRAGADPGISDVLRKVFFGVAKGFAKPARKSCREALEKVKRLPRQPGKPGINAVRAAKDVKLASDAGAVLLFDDAEDATLLNESYGEPELIRFVMENFGRPLAVVGCDEKTLRKLEDEFVRAMREKTFIPDLDTSDLHTAIGNEKSTAEIALEYFGDDLEIEGGGE